MGIRGVGIVEGRLKSGGGGTVESGAGGAGKGGVEEEVQGKRG